MFRIDGQDFSMIVTSLTRNFSVADGENAGRTTDGKMHRDLIGTYYNYTIQFDTSRAEQDEYNRLYEIISAPVESHTIEVAYGDRLLTYEAYITQGSDELIRQYAEDERYWGGLSFDFIAVEPYRYAE